MAFWRGFLQRLDDCAIVQSPLPFRAGIISQTAIRIGRRFLKIVRGQSGVAGLICWHTAPRQSLSADNFNTFASRSVAQGP